SGEFFAAFARRAERPALPGQARRSEPVEDQAGGVTALSIAEQAAWDDVRLRHQDPELHGLVALAREPLDLGDEHAAEIVVPQEVMNEIAEHAATVEPGHEITGVIS